MSGVNITREEAQDRSSKIAVENYAVELDLSGKDATFPSTTTVTFTATAGSSTWIDYISHDVKSITLNGNPISITAADGFRIRLDDLAAKNTLTVVGNSVYMNTGEGLHRFIDPVDNETYLYSQFEIADARRVYACFDQPDLKATYTFTVTAPDHWKVVSNATTPEPEKVSAGVVRYEFPTTVRMSTYITAIVAGPYHEVRSEYSGKFGTYPFGLFCRKSLAEFLDHDEIFEVTRQGFDLSLIHI